MKKLILLFNLILAGVAGAQTNALPPTDSLIQDALLAKQISLTVYPSFSPGLKTKDGKDSQFGFGAAALYPTTSNTFVGVRVDEMVGQVFAGQASAGLNYDFTISGHVVHSFALGGVIANQIGDIGVVAGAGLDTSIWSSASGNQSLDVFVAYDRWFLLGNANIFHLGPVYTIKF